MTCTIEIHDSALTALADGQILAEVPGFAIVQPRELLIGAEAARQRRTFPRQAVSGFWSRLSMEELPVTGARARTWADLGYAQLTELWRQAVATGSDPGPVVFAVPPQFGRERLAILLGIAEHCPFDVIGLVDQVVALTAGAAAPLPTTVIDVSLHHAHCVAVDAAPEIACQHVQVHAECGSLAVQSAWAAHIADQFVRETRYDPLHDGVSEQQLYEHLDAWQAALEEVPTLPVELNRNNTAYQVVLDRSALIAADQDRWRPIVSQLGVDEPIVLTERAAGTPGLKSALGDRPTTIATPLDLARGVLRNMDRVTRKTEDGGYVLVSTLPADASHAIESANQHTRIDRRTPGDPAPKPLAASNNPTHLLVGSKAWVLDGEVLHVGRNGGSGRWAAATGLPGHLCDLVRVGDTVELRNVHPAGTLINGVLVTGRHAIAAGDRIVAPETGVELLAIEVEQGIG